MGVQAQYIDSLLQAAHAFFDASPDSLDSVVEMHTAQTLGAIAAQVVAPKGRTSIDEDMASIVGIAPDFADAEAASDDDLREKLEAFYATREAIAREDAHPAARALESLYPDQEALAITLKIGPYDYGILAVLDQRGSRKWSEAEREVLKELASFAGQAFRVKDITEEREARDGLTGLFDQSYLRRELRLEIQRARMTREPLTVIMFDIDHFKRINDTAGHGAGDDVLRQVSRQADLMSRSKDIVVRYGGEEFAVVLIGADEEAGYTFAERLRASIAEVEAGGWGSWPELVTISCGVASYDDSMGNESKVLIGKADEALYVAKRSGRNQVKRASQLKNPEGTS